MGFVVKNTTVFSPLDWLCPHTCRGCGKLGSVFCERCKKYMLKQRRLICPICKCELAERDKNVDTEAVGDKSKVGFVDDALEECAEYDDCDECTGCTGCESILKGAWVVGWREGAVAKLVADYKYRSVRACGKALAELLDAAIPDLGEADKRVVVVPLPTIGKHVRVRGIDHTWELSKKLAKRRGWGYSRILGRERDTVQVGAKMADRQSQAAMAYRLNCKVDEATSYVLLDDIWTTGASMLSAAKVMIDSGAREVYAVVVGLSKDKKVT